ncbi:hypothetical protein LINGRAPRIM_LOCUS313 [Linum grandiflorum]
METKQQRNAMEKLRNQMKFINVVYVDPIELSGGLALWWTHDTHIEVLRRTKNFIDVRWYDGGDRYNMFVYGAPDRQDRQEVWNQILDFDRDHDSIWCLVGDFNAITSRDEKEGGNSPTFRALQPFNDFIFHAGLIDLGSLGDRFTWSNNNTRGNLINVRLDRAICNDGWMEIFPRTCVFNEPRVHSDHSPIALNLEENGSRPRKRMFFYEQG